jgi:hypothetical protein
LLGAFDEEVEDGDDNPLRLFLKRKQKEDELSVEAELGEHADAAAMSDNDIDMEIRRSIDSNVAEAMQVERIVQSGERKLQLLNDMTAQKEEERSQSNSS